MTTIKAVSLFYTEGKSDKVYHAQLMETDGGFVVNFQYGRRGAALQAGSKTTEPVPKDKAEKTFDKLIAEKVGKGYTQSTTGEVFTTQEFKEKKSDIVPQLLNPIEEDELQSYLKDDSFLAQEKHDGERRLVAVVDGKATGVNRKGLHVPLSDALSIQLNTDMVVDCEIIGDDLFVFDILSLKGKDLKAQSLTDRQKVLLAQKFGKNVSVVESALSTKEKTALFERVKSNNGEGIVFKKKDAAYTGGRPSSGGNCLKYKLYKTATFIVANHTKNKRSVGLILLQGKKEVDVGKVTILPNFKVPDVGTLVEVQYLYANKDGAVYQPVYKGERNDIEREDATVSQLIYKAD